MAIRRGSRQVPISYTLLAALLAAAVAAGTCFVLLGNDGWLRGSAPSHGPSARQELTDEQIITRFHKIFYAARPWAQSSWLGAKIHQHPCDMWIMQEIIVAAKPDFVVETGTLHGASALFFASVLEQVNPDGKVITVDIRRPPESFFERELTRRRIEFIEGDSVSDAVIDAIDERIDDGASVIVLLDSLHSTDHVRRELERYSPFVSKGGYIMVHDTNMGGNPVRHTIYPGPMGAVEKFLEEHDEFVADETQERYLVTFAPSGFLKRIR